MPKAFLLKYKKRCEYFGQRSDKISICENAKEETDLKRTSSDLEEKMSSKGKKPIINHISNVVKKVLL